MGVDGELVSYQRRSETEHTWWRVWSYASVLVATSNYNTLVLYKCHVLKKVTFMAFTGARTGYYELKI